MGGKSKEKGHDDNVDTRFGRIIMSSSSLAVFEADRKRAREREREDSYRNVMVVGGVG